MMIKLTTIAQWVVRLTGPLMVTLGILFWTGRALTLLPLHMLLGIVFVVALWLLSGLAAWAGLRRALVLLSVALGLIIPIFGMMQSRLLPGPAHWVVKVVHLLIGLGAMVVAARLARFIRSNPRHAPRLATDRPLGVSS
jgi:hypothetical protein